MMATFRPFGLGLYTGLLHFNGPTTFGPRCTLMCRAQTRTFAPRRPLLSPAEVTFECCRQEAFVAERLSCSRVKRVFRSRLCIHICTVTCILYENKVRNFSLEEACENNTSSEPKRLCHCHSVAQVWLKTHFAVQTERRS